MSTSVLPNRSTQPPGITAIRATQHPFETGSQIDRIAAEAIAAYERALMMRYGVSRRPSEELAQILIEARDAILGLLHVATRDGGAAGQAESKARAALDRIRSILGP